MECNIKVLFLTKYSQKGASSRYRSFNYKDYFLKNGIIVKYMPLLGDDYIDSLYSGNRIKKNLLAIFYIFKRFLFLLFNISKYDHIVIEAELFPHFNFGLDYFFVKKMKSFSLDFDDNISANYQNTSKQFKIPKLVSLARFVTVGNHWYLSEFKGNLIYLPTVIDIDKYPIHNLEKKELSLVWIGSPSTVKYLKILEGVLVRLSEKHNFVLKIIGGKIELNNKIKVNNIPWSAETENMELASSTIGVMPLTKTYWENGKCGFKLIQYMASGLPVIGSDLPANKEIIENKINGYVAYNEEDWFSNLDFLLSNHDTCLKMGEKSRQRVEQAYSYQVWGEKYANIIKNHI